MKWEQLAYINVNICDFRLKPLPQVEHLYGVSSEIVGTCAFLFGTGAKINQIDFYKND